MTDNFISCDWGTSSFRIRLIETSTLSIIQSLEDAQLGFGQQSLSEEEYLQLYTQKAKHLCTRAGLSEIPVGIISGMASSTIGIKNLAYGTLPLALNDFKIPYHLLTGLSSKTYLISGLATDEDVMRGEEIQLLGAAQEVNNVEAAQLFILPGTHSKHIYLDQNQLITFKTYMTGELFSLLQKHSILKHSVDKQKLNLQENVYQNAFTNGVLSASKALLHELFSIRARQILHHADPAENYAFLSGLLIGNELMALQEYPTANIILCADQPILDFYQLAIKVLYPAISLHVVSTERATLKGQLNLLQQIHQ